MTTRLFKVTRFHVVRMRRRLTVKEVCELTGIPVAEMYRITRAQKEPSRETVEKIAKALDWPVEFFYGKEMDFGWVSTCSLR